MSQMLKEKEILKMESIIELAKKNGASSSEVIYKNRSDNPVSFENNKLKSLESNQTSGIAVRLIKNNKIGIASSTDPDALENIVSSAIEASEYGVEATFEFAKENLNNCRDGINPVSVEASHATPLRPNLENLVDCGTKVIDSLRSFHKDIVISGGFDAGNMETIYLNSNGVFGKRKKSIYSLSFSALLVQDNDFLGIYDGESSLDNYPDEIKIKDKIFEKLNLSRNMIHLETNKYNVIFTPRAVAGIFGEILGVILNGKLIQQKISPLVDKLGKELFDKKLSFIEDPTAGTSLSPFDDEGIKTTKKSLIKEGVINSFYFDLSSASKNLPRQDSTGNGFKSSLSTPPVPGLTSLLINPGRTNHQELIKGIKNGVLVDQVLGAGQSNTLAGEFSVGIDLGFKIEQGEIKGRIKNCMLAGNIFEVLKNISQISSDQEWVGGNMNFPYFLIEGITVIGK